MRYVLTLANVPNLALGFTFVEAAKRAAASRRKRSHGGSAEVPSVPSRPERECQQCLIDSVGE